jgi:hypothetical protein
MKRQRRRWIPCFAVRCKWLSYCCAKRHGHVGPQRAFGRGMVTEWDDTGRVLRRVSAHKEN